ncbi:penicillin-binding transpeptidase domain-containing protein [Jannaschia seohaensis]|uniref:Beta-lactamase class D n=1 Tax=Jannaschia seohaensis TaxID=475081 RepID=A0A2Y9B5C4_9RHOB|nr:penicillin-binding transpeptidase domain-containing protein [Jannaschia seohaensis]PWJ15836.1 beta-lactamase class D [Jannaschia seohaensis]SSA49529.1 beta-lactamase class D [Jannaschia seohaensis]
MTLKAGRHILIAALLVISAQAAFAETRSLDPDALSPALEGRTSDFLAVDLGDGTRCELAGSDLTRRHAPWSTFKIPNFVNALETGVALGPDHWRDWDQDRRPAAAYWPRAWRQGQTLAAAFQRSAAWYFQDVALDVGEGRYRQILEAWAYGNANAPDGDDGFWLGGPLTVSVEEQVAFVGALLSGEIDVAPATLDALFSVSADGALGAHVVHGKTGSGPVEPGRFDGAFEGWYVGWLARQGAAPVALAHYVRAQTFSDLRTFRRDHALVLLEACGF